MRRLLLVSSVIELGAGLALVLIPSRAVLLLLGAQLDAPVALVLGRVAGAALASLGVACWHARGAPGVAARAVVVAMLVYNVAVAVLLLGARLGTGLGGGTLIAAALLHVGMAAWCVACLRSNRG